MILIYLDPGSGSFLIQLAIAALAGVTIFIGSQWAKIKRLFNKKNNLQNDVRDDASDDEDEDN